MLFHPPLWNIFHSNLSGHITNLERVFIISHTVLPGRGTTSASLSVSWALIAQGYDKDDFLAGTFLLSHSSSPSTIPPLALLLCVNNSSLFVLLCFFLSGHLCLLLGIGSTKKLLHQMQCCSPVPSTMPDK